MSKILCVCLSATIQKTILFDSLNINCVNRSKGYRLDASGKAVNSCRVLNQLEKGCSVALCSLGKKNKALFLELAQKDAMKIIPIEVSGFTRECCTLIDSSKATTTELVVGEPVCSDDFDKKEYQLLSIIRTQIKKVDAVLLAGSKPLGWSENIYSKIAEITTQNNKIFFADYWGKDLITTIQTSIPSIIKINEEEFINTFCCDFARENVSFSDDELKNKIVNKSQELQNIIIVTRGCKSTFSAANGVFYETPVKKVNAVNVIACGDSFSAGFLYEYIKSKDINASLQTGTDCAAKNAESLCPGSIV